LPDSASQIGDEIRQAREACGLTQADLAIAVGRDVQTISRWERGERQPKAADVDRVHDYLRHYMNEHGIGLGRTVSRGTGRVAEASPRPQAPSWLDRFIDDTMLGLARAGATNEQARYIRDVLRSDETLRFVLRNDDGTPRELAAQESQIRDLVEGFRFWVERSRVIAGGIAPPATPGGAPVAPVYATTDPTAAAAKPESRTKKK
jgi:transcriptional regulator with XRE-family HTH domain